MNYSYYRLPAYLNPEVHGHHACSLRVDRLRDGSHDAQIQHEVLQHIAGLHPHLSGELPDSDTRLNQLHYWRGRWWRLFKNSTGTGTRTGISIANNSGKAAVRTMSIVVSTRAHEQQHRRRRRRTQQQTCNVSSKKRARLMSAPVLSKD